MEENHKNAGVYIHSLDWNTELNMKQNFEMTIGSEFNHKNQFRKCKVSRTPFSILRGREEEDPVWEGTKCHGKS